MMPDLGCSPGWQLSVRKLQHFLVINVTMIFWRSNFTADTHSSTFSPHALKTARHCQEKYRGHERFRDSAGLRPAGIGTTGLVPAVLRGLPSFASAAASKPSALPAMERGPP